VSSLWRVVTRANIVIWFIVSLCAYCKRLGILTKLLTIIILTRSRTTDLMKVSEAVWIQKFFRENCRSRMRENCAISAFWRVVAWSDIIVRFIWSAGGNRERLTFIAELFAVVVLPWCGAADLIWVCKSVWPLISGDNGGSWIRLGRAVSSLWRVVTRANIVIWFIVSLCAYCKRLGILTEFVACIVGPWACKPLSLNCKSAWSAWRVIESHNRTRRSLLRDRVRSLRRIVAWSNYVTGLTRSFCSDCERLSIISKLIPSVILSWRCGSNLMEIGKTLWTTEFFRKDG
jgi:hypothetical protein